MTDLPQSDAPTVRRLVILGNVNVGKTSLFDKLTAAGEHAVNIPGSTHTAKRGLLRVGSRAATRPFLRNCAACSHHGPRERLRRKLPGSCCETVGYEASCPALKGKPGRTGEGPAVTHLFDTPGSATLAATSEDEMVARDLLLSGAMDGVLLVADAKNMRRTLALALEVAEFGLPMVLCLNMLDEAELMGVEVDDAALTRILSTPITRTIAVQNVGITRLAQALDKASPPQRLVTFPDALEAALTRMEELLSGQRIPARALGILTLTGDRGVRTWLSRRLDRLQLDELDAQVIRAQESFNTPLDVVIADSFHAEAGRIAGRTVVRSAAGPDLLVRFGHLAQRPFPGLLIGLGVLVLAYYWIGAFGATFVVDNLSTRLFDGLLIPLCERAVAHIPSAFLRDAIMDPDFGLLPAGLFLAIGIVLPVLFCFYLLQAVLEDSGYLPRLSVLFDQLFRWLGLNGQGLIPLVLGFSCVAMAVITTRMLPTRKERVLLTLLLTLGVPCAPLLAVMLVILGDLPWTASVAVFGVLLTQTALLGYVAHRMLPGALPDLILEIPRMRIPRPRVLLAKTWRNTWQFMREALPIFLAASFGVFIFDRIGGLALLENLAHPVVNGMLGLPDEAVQVFIKTMIRRENGATELSHMREHFNGLQMVVTMVVMVFLIPCINTVIVVFKERGVRDSLAILTTVVVYAMVVGTAVNWLCRGLGITFG